MNVLFLCDEYPPGPHGGIGTAVQTQARAMVRLGHTVVVAGFYDWGYGGEDAEWDEGVQVYRFRRGLDGAWARQRNALLVRIAYRVLRKTGVFQWDIDRSLPRYGRFLAQLIAKHSLQIIEASDFQDYVQHLRRPTPLPLPEVPVVVKLHGTITYFNEEAGCATPDAIRQTERQLLQAAHHLVSVSQYTAGRTNGIFNLSVPTTVVYNGIDARDIPPARQRNPHQVVFTGTLVAKKGVYQLLQAWNHVVEQVPDAQLLVYGKGALEKLRAVLHPAALARVRFMGHVHRAELLHILSETPIAVFPSYAETFGLGAAEAMACGAAVIYSTRTAGPEVVQDGVSGLLVDPDDVPALTNALVHLLRTPHLCMQLGVAAQQRVAQEFDSDMLARRHTRLYETLIQNSPSH